jgi:energy-coupling factor transport system permease protein
LILLAGAFTLFFATTTSAELRMALEWLRIPYRYAFSLSLALQSVGMLDDEWRAIKEAQRSRGAWSSPSGWRRTLEQMRDLVALTVPTVVVTARRAWAVTEAAYARGFNSPNRRSYHQLAMSGLDWLLLTGTSVIGGLLLFWR